jgi:hypothetical protein
MPEYLVAHACADQAAENPTGAAARTDSPASQAAAQEPTEHPAKAATFARFSDASIRPRKSLILDAIRDMWEERTGASLHCGFINAKLLCDLTRTTRLIKQRSDIHDCRSFGIARPQ